MEGGQEVEVIREFQGEYRFLSNFWYVDVELDGVVYPSVEHAYQAAKTLDEMERKNILYAPTAFSAKRRGKQVIKRKDWDDIKVIVMYNLLRQKFKEGELKRKLLSTGNKILKEGNDRGDIFWGVDIRSGKGKNQLGKLLMAVREEVGYVDK